MQSISKLGFVLATKRGVGGYIQEMPYTWQLSWLAAERPWSALVGPFLTQIGVETTPPLVGDRFLVL